MTADPPSDTGLEPGVTDDGPRYEWLTPDRQATVRTILLGIALFAGLVVWVWHSLGADAHPAALAAKLLTAPTPHAEFRCARSVIREAH